MAGRGVSPVVVRRVELGGATVDVHVDGGVITAIEPTGTSLRADVVIEGDGGAVLPGLHDHHLHLLAMAGARRSIEAGADLDPAVTGAHRRAEPGAWLRVVGYDESVHGPLDRWRLDALAPGRAVRVQHRSGALWVLSSAALDAVGLIADEGAGSTDDGSTGDGDGDGDGVERDERGEPTGLLFRLDGWLRSRLPVDPPPHLAPVGARLAALGITGVTDCTPSERPADFELIAAAVRDGDLPVTVVTTGGVALATAQPPEPLRRGPVKVVLSDHDLPALADVVEWFGRAHAAGRPVAVHCVTRESLLLAVTAWGEVGSVAGDRIEHASVTPVELIAQLARLGLSVVTQPGFIPARGDAYRRNVDAADRPDLYRCASLIGGGVEVGGSTDAPFGPDDPWLAIAAAVSRLSDTGQPVGSDHGLLPADALGLFLAPLDRPGGRPREVHAGAPADLCVLDRPLAAALAAPSSDHVVATVAGGVVSYRR